MTRQRVLIAIAAVFLGAVAGYCQIPKDRTYDGTWNGRLSNFWKIAFTIQDGAMTTFDIDMSRPSEPFAGQAMTFESNPPAIANKTLNLVNTPSAVITFDTPTTAHGTVDLKGDQKKTDLITIRLSDGAITKMRFSATKQPPSAKPPKSNKPEWMQNRLPPPK